MQQILEPTITVEKDGLLTNESRAHGLLKAVHEKIRIIATADANQILRTNEATGELIVPAQHTVERLINMFRILRRCGLEVLTSKELAAVLETSLRVTTIFESIRTFEPGAQTGADQPGTPEQLVAQADAVARSAYQTLGIIIAKTFCLGEYFTTQVDGVGDHFTSIMNVSNEARETLSDLQRLARYEVTNKFSESFDAEVRQHNKFAWIWTIATGVFAVSGIGFLAASLHSIKVDTSLPAANVLALVVSQLAIAGIIVYLMIFSAKNAASHRHNEVVNIQRRNALRTANIVADASPTDAFKDSILVQAAHSAYDPQPTGFGNEKPPR